MVKRVTQLTTTAISLLAVCVLCACVSAPQSSPTVSRPAPQAVPEPSGRVPESIAINIPEPASPEAIPPRQTNVFHGPTTGGNRQPVQNPAVVSLLDKSYLKQQQGDLSGAASTVERGMRIAPQDASLWQRLAQIRMQQGLFDQAIEIARKSTSLGQGMSRLISDNWLLISSAYAQLGNSPASQSAKMEADRYQR